MFKNRFIVYCLQLKHFFVTRGWSIEFKPPNMLFEDNFMAKKTTEKAATLLAKELEFAHAYWREANSPSGQVYLLGNPLLKEHIISKMKKKLETFYQSDRPKTVVPHESKEYQDYNTIRG